MQNSTWSVKTTVEAPATKNRKSVPTPTAAAEHCIHSCMVNSLEARESSALLRTVFWSTDSKNADIPWAEFPRFFHYLARVSGRYKDQIIIVFRKIYQNNF
jgi:hypothetical protein